MSKKNNDTNAGLTKGYLKKIWNFLMSFTSPLPPEKILLIVDDLDRCEMSEMLCVIESIVLLLDEDDLKDKLQIAMLVEEEAVRLAIGQKYIEMIRSRNFQQLQRNNENSVKPETDNTHPHELNKELYSKMGSEVINENIEKLFLCSLKLGKLSKEEKLEAMFNFLKEDNSKLIEENIDDDIIPTEPKTTEPKTTEPKTTEPKTTESDLTTSESKIVITQDECNELRKLIANWGIDTEDRWGLRALRALKFKYIFARSLLKEFGVMVTPEKLCEVLKYELEEQKESTEKDFGSDDIYRKIVKQII